MKPVYAETEATTPAADADEASARGERQLVVTKVFVKVSVERRRAVVQRRSLKGRKLCNFERSTCGHERSVTREQDDQEMHVVIS